MKIIFFSVCITIFLKTYFCAYIGSEKLNNGRVIGGEKIDISDAPYIVAIERYNPDSWEDTLICGGAILNKNLILTVAHPFDGYRVETRTISVRAGSRRHYTYGQQVSVLDILRHSKYNASNSVYRYDYNIAILRLRTTLEINPNVNTEVIKIPPIISLDVGLPVDVTGWGASATSYSTILSKVTLHILNPIQCISTYPYQFTDRMLCVSDIDFNKHACALDVGGPMVLQGTYLLLGIVSFGNNCSNLLYPTVFTNVANPEIHSFITSIVERYAT